MNIVQILSRKWNTSTRASLASLASRKLRDILVFWLIGSHKVRLFRTLKTSNIDEYWILQYFICMSENVKKVLVFSEFVI